MSNKKKNHQEKRKFSIKSQTPLPFLRYENSLTALLFCSGFSSLVFEVLWMKQLTLLFGNTVYATAATLAAFFLGLAAGGYFWGNQIARSLYPVKCYGWLEIGVAFSACGYFFILRLYHIIYGALFQHWSDSILFIVVKFFLALVLVFLPAFFMGGTLPVISQYLIPRSDVLGRTASKLYAVNTIGAASGAFFSGFIFIRFLGFNKTYATALFLTICVSLIAFGLGRKCMMDSSETSTENLPVKKKEEREGVLIFSLRTICALSFFSGFATISLEVLWTRMFVQVFQNSVYTFSAILVTVLLGLALGAVLANFLARQLKDYATVFWFLLMACAICSGISSHILEGVTSGLEPIQAQGGWIHYMGTVFITIVVCVGPPIIMLGTIFPYLLKLVEPYMEQAGEIVGKLISLNTFGAILGSLSTGFLFLNLFGLWISILLMSCAYFTIAILLPSSAKKSSLKLRLTSLSCMIAILLLIPLNPLSKIRLNKAHGEELVELFEGSGGLVSVTRIRDSLIMKLNGHYGLGSSAALVHEQMQAHIPFLLRPGPKKVFFLGMGTGITAGAALKNYPVERVVTCELVPEVIKAAEKHFEPFVNGLFKDPRSTVVIEDGRNYLLGSGERFDAIISDVFIPWKAGTGSLYTREHFTTVWEHLEQGGLFAQWIPLYQMTDFEFSSISRTMIEVFPQVTLFRLIFDPNNPVVVLIGQKEKTSLPPVIRTRRFDKKNMVEGKSLEDSNRLTFPLNNESILLLYCGNLSQAREIFDDYPINTDDRPVIEYVSPMAQFRLVNGECFFVRERFAVFLRKLLEKAPPEEDPFLKNLLSEERQLVRAGLSLYQTRVNKVTGNRRKAERSWLAFLEYMTK
jgi:spermidine synthase